jgi:hypothetical protein
LNIKKYILSGLIAGFIINVSAITMVPVVGNEMTLALSRFNLPPLSIGAMIFFCVVSFILGFSVMLIYVVLKAKMKSTISVVLLSSIFIWLVGYLIPNMANYVYGFMPLKLTIIGIIWGLVEQFVACLIASRFYKIE